jgi:hypothetical protein
LATLVGAALALFPAAAHAAAPPPVPAPPPQPQPQPTPPPAPAPVRGSLKLNVTSGVPARGRQYVLTGDNVNLVGHVKPFVSRQTVRVRITTGRHKKVIRKRIGKGRGEGIFHVRFRARSDTTYTIYVRHNRTAKQALFAARAGVGSVAPGSGMAVSLLKQGLRTLGYPAGNGPAITGKLGRELMAFRKVNGMARNYDASRTIYEMVFAGRGAFKLRYPDAGKHVEADISRQVVVLADKGKPVGVYPTSSGSWATPTVLGHYRFYLKAPGTNAKGMFMSNYFTGNYAIHGYPDVPTYNASHGCLRIPNADAVSVFNQIDLGESIWVYP